MFLAWTYSFVFFLFGTLLNFSAPSDDLPYSGDLAILTAPTMTITAAEVNDGDTSNDSNLSLLFNASESTLDFDASDINVTNGILSGFSGSGAAYTATFTPSSDGTCTIEVQAGSFTDNEANLNLSSNQFSWSYDSTNPTIIITANEVSSGATSNDATLSLSFSTSESTSDFDASDVVVTNGTLSSFSGSGTAYTATFTPSSDGTCTIDVDAATFTDEASNNNNAATQFSWTFDSSGPMATISSSTVINGQASSDASIQLTILLSEPSSTFGLDDITSNDGTLGNFLGSGTSYTATFTASAIGSHTLYVGAGTFSDASGNLNTASTNFVWYSFNCDSYGAICDDGNELTQYDVVKANASGTGCTCAGITSGTQFITGCMDPQACNYKSEANFPGACEYEDTAACLFCSQTIGTSPHGNGLGVLDDKDINNNDICDADEFIGCTDPVACNFWHAATADPDPANGLYGDACAYADSTICEYCAGTDDDGEPFLIIDEINGDTTRTDSSYIVWQGDLDDDNICAWNEILGCTDENACNYDSLATELTSDSICVTPGFCGCDTTGTLITAIELAEGACNCDGDTLDILGDCGGPCLADTNANDICDVDEIVGCMDVLACNYDASANIDSLCVLSGVCGCDTSLTGEITALGILDGFCGCNGEILDSLGVCLLPADTAFCLADTNENGLCDSLEVQGCTDSNSCSYLASLLATFDDGTCKYTDPCGDCNHPDSLVWGVDPNKCNCLGHVLDSIGACLPVGHTDFCETDVNNNDLCDDDETEGCTDPLACNFNPDATFSLDICEEADYCGECGGTETEANILAQGECNCLGDTLDALGICGGGCSADLDDDDICDDIDLCISVIGGIPCDPATNPNCPRLDDCNNCKAANDPTYGINPDCGCIWDIPAGACSDCIVDTTALGGYVLRFPDPLKDCEGNCLHGQDDGTGQCLHASNAVPTSLPNVTDSRIENNTLILEQSPLKLQEWTVKVDSLHARMARNLDDGTLTGASDTLTIEEFILDRGDMVVEGETRLQDSLFTATGARIGGDVTIGGNLLVSQEARILGTTFSDGGLETTSLDMQGDLNVGGAVRMDSTLIVAQRATMQDTIHLEKAMTIGNHNVVLMDDEGYLKADSVEVVSDLIVRDSTILRGVLDVQGNLKVHQNKFTVDAVTGNTEIGGSLNVADTTTLSNPLNVIADFKVKQNEIDYFTVTASTGATNVLGNLSVAESTTLTQGITVNGQTSTFNTTADIKGILNVKNSAGVPQFSVNPSSSGPRTTIRTPLTLTSGLTLTGETNVDGNFNIKTGSTTKFSVTNTTGATTMGALTATDGTFSGDFNHTTTSSIPFQSTAKQFRLGKNSVTTADNSTTANAHAVIIDATGTNKNDGVLIKLDRDSALVSNSANFITFMSKDNRVVGRIEGEKSNEFQNDNGYNHEARMLNNEWRDAIFELSSATKEGAFFAAGLVFIAIKGSTDWMPNSFWQIPDWPEGTADAAALWWEGIVGGIMHVYHITTAVTVYTSADYNRVHYDQFKTAEVGVTYQSGSGDYAELIEKQFPRQELLPGQIIGIKNGKASLNTTDVDHLFVVSTDPIVLGNTKFEDEDTFVPAAFMGQVPIRVVGHVESGDFILASGDADGFGIARSREELRLADIQNVVGVAWEDGNDEYLIQNIHCSVGVQNHAIPLVIEKMSEEIQSLLMGNGNTYVLANGLPTGVVNKPQTSKTQSDASAPTNTRTSNGGDAQWNASNEQDDSDKNSTDGTIANMQQTIAQEVLDILAEEVGSKSVTDYVEQSKQLMLETMNGFESDLVNSDPKSYRDIVNIFKNNAEISPEVKRQVTRIAHKIADVYFSPEAFELSEKRMRVLNPELFKTSEEQTIGSQTKSEIQAEVRNKIHKEIDQIFKY